jgi:hypothetical protein
VPTVTRLARLAAALLALAPAGRAAAGVFDVLEPDTDWTLLHPAPRAELRELVETNGPRTADAGHLQLDVDVVQLSLAAGDAREAGEAQLELFALDARLGLTRRTDLQVSFVPYRRADVLHVGGAMTSGRGIGDTTVRLGLNLWGNDGGPTAAGLVPFLRIPTATGGVGSGAFEGGVAVPMTIEAPEDVEVLGRVEVEFADDRMGRRGVHPRMSFTGGAGREVIGPVDAKLEWTTTVDAEGAVMTYTHDLDAVARLAISHDLRLDLGASFAMLTETTTVRPYVQVAYRR